MKKPLSCLLLTGLLAFSPLESAFAKEELLVIQTVSKDRRSFVVSKGIKDGILKGQEVIFANDNVSVVCKAVEVNRTFSLWVPIDRNITVPFNKEDIISSNSAVYGNVALDVAGDPNLVITLKDNEIISKFQAHNTFTAKASYNRGLNQASSSVASEKNNNRSGYSVAIDYNYRFLPEFEMSAGARLDNEVYRIEQPELDVPTTRIMGVLSATYHFVNFSKNKNNFYLTLAAGIGRSETTVDDEKSSGIVALIPEARLGYVMPFTKSVAMIFEGSVESLSTTETFSNGTEQTTNMINMKATIGLRF